MFATRLTPTRPPMKRTNQQLFRTFLRRLNWPTMEWIAGLSPSPLTMYIDDGTHRISFQCPAESVTATYTNVTTNETRIWTFGPTNLPYELKEYYNRFDQSRINVSKPVHAA